MTDADREAFEKWAHSTNRNELWVVGDKDIAYETWQAARDHYAPKLTETDIPRIAKILCEQAAFLNWEQSSFAAKNNWIRSVETALRSAGVRFKEET
jgi:hypothetical protein